MIRTYDLVKRYDALTAVDRLNIDIRSKDNLSYNHMANLWDIRVHTSAAKINCEIINKSLVDRIYHNFIHLFRCKYINADIPPLSIDR